MRVCVNKIRVCVDVGVYECVGGHNDTAKWKS